MFDGEKQKASLTEELRGRPVIHGVQKSWIFAVTITGVVVIAAIGGLYIHSQKQVSQLRNEVQQIKKDPTAQATEENKTLLQKVGALIVLPADEQPTVATVTDLEKLKGQPFFAQAQLGDKVLIYTAAKKAILYRPTENKIIELAPLENASNVDQK